MYAGSDLAKEYVDEYGQYVYAYFDWLCEYVNVENNRYESLMRELYCIDFEWILELDSNRAYDGLILRDDYTGGDKTKIFNSRLETKPCSVLEALIGLAQRMNFILDGEDRGDRTRVWFWEFIDNLGLDKFTNFYIGSSLDDGLNPFDEIRDICNTWMYRKFEYTGKGSPFPVDTPYEDQRSLDMIRQINSYVLEKHMYGDELL